MRKLLLVLGLMFAISTSSYAAEKQVKFIYIHGANNGPVEAFQKCLDKEHPDLKKNFEKNEFVRTHLLKGATVDENTSILYWADKALETKKGLKDGLAISDQYTSGVPQVAKEFIAYLLHDSIWVQKYTNMYPVLTDLQNEVMKNYKNGEKTIIVGYSAGTFVAYQYMLNKYKYFDVVNAMIQFKQKFNWTDEQIAIAKKYAPKYTCLSALADSDMLVVNGFGNLEPSPDRKNVMLKIKNLKKQTEISCVPDDATIGVFNYGSPLTVFYPDLLKQNSQAQIMTIKLMKHLVENDKIFLTVNYAKDPFGIPFHNYNYTELKQLAGVDIKKGNGFTYNKVIRGGRNPIVAHSMYWMRTNAFTKDLAKAYEEGYKSFYEIKD